MTFEEWEKTPEAREYAGLCVLLSEEGEVIYSADSWDDRFQEAVLEDNVSFDQTGWVAEERYGRWQGKDLSEEAVEDRFFLLSYRLQGLSDGERKEVAALANEICLRSGALPLYEVLKQENSSKYHLSYRLNTLEVALLPDWDDEYIEAETSRGSGEEVARGYYISLLLSPGLDEGMLHGSSLLMDEIGEMEIRLALSGEILGREGMSCLAQAKREGAGHYYASPDSVFSLALKRSYGAVSFHSVESLLDRVTRVSRYLGVWWEPRFANDKYKPDFTTEVEFQDAEKTITLYTSPKEILRVTTYADNQGYSETEQLFRDDSQEMAEENKRKKHLYDSLCAFFIHPRPDNYQDPLYLPLAWNPYDFNYEEDADIQKERESEKELVWVTNWELLRQELTAYQEDHPELSLSVLNTEKTYY
jgi:hypothetical protein